MSCSLRQTQDARLAGVFVLVMFFLMLSGCAATPNISPDTARRIAPSTLLDEVPFHGQRDYQCGPASLSMALAASDVTVDVDTLIPQVFLPGRQGSIQPEMLATVRRHGRIPFILEGGFEALLGELNAGHPVVVLQNLSLPWWPVWHYAVAIGYDRQAEDMILHSGMTPQQRTDFDRFDATWARSDRWGFVALSPGKLPSQIEVDTAMRAITNFEDVQGSEAALPAWNALVERYSRHAMARFAQANARHASGDVIGAIDAFRAATRQDPKLGVAWLNLGLLLQARGEDSQARQAIKKAAQLPGPWQERARKELEKELE